MKYTGLGVEVHVLELIWYPNLHRNFIRYDVLPLALYVYVGFESFKQCFVCSFQDSNMISLGSFIVAAALEHWNIHRRIALKMLLLVGAEPKW